MGVSVSRDPVIFWMEQQRRAASKYEALSNSTPVTAVTSFESRHGGTLPMSLTSAHSVAPLVCRSEVCFGRKEQMFGRQ